ILASLGVRSLDEVVGRVDMLMQAHDVPNARGGALDLSALLSPPDETWSREYKQQQDRNDPPVSDPFHAQVLADAAAAWENGKRLRLSYEIRNANRAVGARVSHEVSRLHGGDGLPEGTLEMRLHGSAGQSFGAF